MIGSLERHLAAIFGGERRRGRPVDKIKNFEEKKVLVKNYYTGSAATYGAPRGRVPHGIFNIYWVFGLAGLAGGSTIENLTQIFLFSKYICYWNIMETCGRQEKVASGCQVLLGIFIQIHNLFWRYAELNRFWVGWTKFPFYELGQQERGQGCIRYKWLKATFKMCATKFN